MFLESAPPLPLELEDRLLATIENESQNASKAMVEEVHDAPTLDAEQLT